MDLDKKCLYRPVIFFKRNGELLSVENIQNQSMTEFFLITSIDKNSMTLMQLSPCLVCYPSCTLEPTYQYTTIAKNVLCGYQLLEDFYIRNCNHIIASFTDCIYKTFTIVPGYDEITLWKSNLADNQYGSLRVWLQELPSTPIEIVVHQKDKEVISLLYSESILLDQCIKVTIRTNGKEKVKGVFKIDMESIVDI